MRNPQPMQPVIKDKSGILRFRENAIVSYLLDVARRHNVANLNSLAERVFSQEDREQFAQLIGYAISGYHELPYVSDESAAQAHELARTIEPEAGGCRDEGCPIHGGLFFNPDSQRTPSCPSTELAATPEIRPPRSCATAGPPRAQRAKARPAAARPDKTTLAKPPPSGRPAKPRSRKEKRS